MAETVANFDTPVQDRFGERYTARACGRQRSDGLWEGWIEFESISSSEVLRSQRELLLPHRVQSRRRTLRLLLRNRPSHLIQARGQ